MSETETDHERGPAQADAVPPVDALATVAVDGEALSTVGVPAGDRVAVHLSAYEQGPQVDEFETVEDVPEPAHADEVPDDHNGEFVVPGHSWVGIVVDGTPRGRFTASRDERVSLHVERAEGDIDDPTTWVSTPNPGGSTGEDGGAT